VFNLNIILQILLENMSISPRKIAENCLVCRDLRQLP